MIAWEYLKRSRAWVIGTVSILVIIILLQFKLNLIQRQSSIRIGLIGTYQEHDLPPELTKLVSEGLVEASADGRIKPNLVSGWEVNNDATEFKFKLKDNLRWSDNTPVKADDLEFAIPNTKVTFPNNKTIQFNLSEAYSPLPSLLTKPILKKGGGLIGLGGYKITKVEKSRIFITKITLKPNDPKLPVIYARFYPNEKVGVTGFNLGEVEALMGLSNPKEIPQNSLIGNKSRVDYSKIVTILFQTTDPLLRSRSLRQALFYETPKIAGEEIADNPYPPNLWAYNPDAKKYLQSPEEAKAALERAKSQMSDKEMNAELILTAIPNLEQTGKEIVAAWKKLGFDVKLRLESGIPQNFQSLLITQSIPIDPDQYFLWHATQTKTNLTKYDSKRVDKNLEDGRKIISEDDRKAKYFDFQKALLEDAPAAFLYFPKYNIVYLKKVEPFLNQIIKE